MNIDDYVSNERDFLHGIATPLMVASGQVEFLLEQLKAGDSSEIELRLNKVCLALTQVTDQLNDRRDFIKNTYPVGK